jgi:hypothetical protein
VKTIIPPNITSKMSSADRKRFGVRTPEEDKKRWNAKAEGQLHEQIFALLKRNDIPYVHAPMFKRSTLPTGMPDFLFAWRGFPIAWECKVGKNTTKMDQDRMIVRLEACGWFVFIIHDLQQAQEILNGFYWKPCSTCKVSPDLDNQS